MNNLQLRDAKMKTGRVYDCGANDMQPLPETNESLLVRLADASDAAAWDEFVAIYRPMIVRIGLGRGLQACDADDIAQQVLMSVSRAIGNWKKDPSKGTFRSWLRTIARNAIINQFQRGTNIDAVGGSGFLNICHSVESDEEIDQWIDSEHERATIRLAASRVNGKVSLATWLSFWRTANGEAANVVADDLGLSVGKVYGARGRVMKLLRKEVEDISNQDK
jgi:RNA polymerase sigma-70 factor, ECF subfamily